MESRAHAFAAGLFTLLLAAAAIIGLWWLGQSGPNVSMYLLETRRNVTGLNLEALVRYRGIRAGRVEDISVDDKDPRVILVRISLDSRYRLTKGTTAQLGYQGITGLAYVQLEDDGSHPEPLVATDGRLPRLALKPTVLDTLGEKADDIVGQVALVTERLARLLDEKNVANLSRTLENTAAASEGLKELPQVVAALRQTLSETNLKRLADVLEHLDQASADAGPLVAEARQTVKAMSELSRRLDVLAGEAGADTLPRANVLLEELTADSRRLSRLLDTLEQNPNALVFGKAPARPGPGEPGFAAPGK